MLATAIVHRPAVLILDEPSVGLDPEQRLRLRQLLRSYADSGTVLVSTHLLDDVATTADRLVVLNDARVRYEGDVAGLLDAAAGGGSKAELATDLESAYIDLLRGSR